MSANTRGSSLTIHASTMTVFLWWLFGLASLQVVQRHCRVASITHTRAHTKHLPVVTQPTTAQCW
jgi:hypothetical protein